ncbi:hypothetical protein HZH68_015151 [Vespula germanica]|uniref:Uncharacterized protein n=1 Tax=Vespula germanica TaxID=30212 RepID=A0A834J8D0_VESGE|nr:hypothetical protein HZH68_015151 [Vespula germanica]
MVSWHYSSVPINHLAHGPAIRLLEEGVIILPDCCDARPPWVQYWTLSPLENRLTWRRLCHGNVEVLGAISTGRFNDSAGSHEPPQKDSNLSANTKCLHSPFSSEESTFHTDSISFDLRFKRCSSNGGSSSRCIQPIRVNLERGMPTTILKDSSRCGPC